MKRLKTVIFYLLVSVSVMAGNTITKETQVTNSKVVSTATDFHITSAEPFATTGSVNLVNADAVLIFDALKPSLVKQNWLASVKIDGETASSGVNCRVGIYENGTIVYPHAKDGFHPLTVFSEQNFKGDNTSDFELTKFYNGLGVWTNRIRSIKLKRGYMATLACDSLGTGYSRVFVAQDEDLEVADLGRNLSGKVAFVRIFPWNKVTKKGLGGTKAYNTLFNATWSWNWGANNVEYDDEEYVPSHETETWPSWSSIMKIDKSNHLLGNCEPDNKVGEKITVDKIEATMFKSGSWQKMYRTGMRVVSPAPGGGATDEVTWLKEFMRCAKAYNCRIDAIAVHKYNHNSGSWFNSQMNTLYQTFGLPIWITEWNYGGNWTSEKWPSGNRKGTDENYAHELAGIKDICSALEKNSHVERYSIYNWVEDCRKIYAGSNSSCDPDSLTPAGEYYAALKSKPAYTGGEGYVMTWNYIAPADLKVKYMTGSYPKLSWIHNNGKQTDKVVVERKINGIDSDFKVIKSYPMTEKQYFFFEDSTFNQSDKDVAYRVHNYDSDGKERYSNEVTAVKSIKNYVDGWDANGIVGVGSEPNKHGWKSTPSSNWQEANGSGSRYQDCGSGEFSGYKYDGRTYTSKRILWIRYKNNEKFTYDIPSLDAAKNYKFSFTYGWHNNASVPTIHVGLYSRSDSALIADTTITCSTTKREMLQAEINFQSLPDPENYYIAFTSNVNGDVIVALGDLLVIKEEDVAKTDYATGWDADGMTGTDSEPNKHGWDSTPAVKWGQANGSNNRYCDKGTFSGYTIRGSEYNSDRILWIRYNKNEEFTYATQKMPKGTTYKFSFAYGWHNNSTVPTLTVGVYSQSDSKLIKNIVVTCSKTKKEMQTAELTFKTKNEEDRYYLSFKSNVNGDVLVALGDLSITNVSDESGATSINAVTALPQSTDKRIYNTSGQYVGTDVRRLNKGIYIIGKRKIVLSKK